MAIEIKFSKDPDNKEASSMILDLRNSTALHRLLKKKQQRMLIVEMMIGIHEKILNYLYSKSGVKESDFSFNDTGDGYIVVFTNNSHAISCVLCAVFIRDFLREHIANYNKKLFISRKDFKYSFGIGVHTAYARIIEMEYETKRDQKVFKKFILGNAANSSARVESMTKNFVGIDLIITGHTRCKCYSQAMPEFKILFKKNGSYMNQIGEIKHKIKDGKSDGHLLYFISDDFKEAYQAKMLM